MIALIYVDTNSKKRGQIPKLRTIIIYDFMLLYKDNIRPPGNTRVSSASNDNVREPRFVDAAKTSKGIAARHGYHFEDQKFLYWGSTIIRTKTYAKARPCKP